MVLKPLTDEEIAILQGHAEVAAARFGAEELCGVPASQLSRLLDFAGRAKKLLGEIEWAVAWACPECLADKEDGHKPRCELAALIGKP